MERFDKTGQEDRDPHSPLEGGLPPSLPDLVLLLNHGGKPWGPQSTCVVVLFSSQEPKQEPSRSAQAPGIIDEVFVPWELLCIWWLKSEATAL